MMKKAVALIMVAFVIMLSQSAFFMSHTPFSNDAHRTPPTWTFMVYMAADNSLSSYTAGDLAEMMSIGSSANLNVVVFYDSTEIGDTAIYYIEKGKKILVDSPGEMDTGKASTLIYFLNFTIHNYPADHYFLDLWDHGNYFGGIALDHGDWLTLNELDYVLNYADNLIGKKIDIVGFDACRMGGIEVFYALQNYADYAIASEKDEPADGWPYDWILERMVNETPENVAKIVVDSYYDWAKKFYSNSGLSVTLAYVNLTKFAAFMDIFNEYLAGAYQVAYYYAPEILNASIQTENYELSSMKDLYNLMQNFEKIGDYKLSLFANKVMESFTDMIYYRVWDCPNPANGVHAVHAHGMGIYFPTYFYDISYSSTAFAQNTLWDEFLRRVLYSTPIHFPGTANVSFSDGMVWVNYSADVSYGEIYIVNDTSVIYSGILGPEANYSANINYGIYDVYIYGYNENSTVIWVYKERISYLMPVLLKGTVYINGASVKNAKIKIEIGNETYFVYQNDSSGFSLVLYYPQQINENSTINITVYYEYFRITHTYRVNMFKGNITNATITLIIKDTVFPTYSELAVMLAFIAVGFVIVLYYMRKKRF